MPAGPPPAITQLVEMVSKQNPLGPILAGCFAPANRWR